MTPKEKHTQIVKNTARLEGFDFVGISTAQFLEEEASNLEKWLKNDLHGKMQYMENHFDKRLDPRKLVDGAKSVVSLLYNYYTRVGHHQFLYNIQYLPKLQIFRKVIPLLSTATEGVTGCSEKLGVIS